MFMLIVAIAFRIISGGPSEKFSMSVLPVILDGALLYAILDHYWGGSNGHSICDLIHI